MSGTVLVFAAVMLDRSYSSLHWEEDNAKISTLLYPRLLPSKGKFEAFGFDENYLSCNSIMEIHIYLEDKDKKLALVRTDKNLKTSGENMRLSA